MGDSPLLAFDSTTLSTYSENQSEARLGQRHGQNSRMKLRAVLESQSGHLHPAQH